MKKRIEYPEHKYRFIFDPKQLGKGMLKYEIIEENGISCSKIMTFEQYVEYVRALINKIKSNES